MRNQRKGYLARVVGQGFLGGIGLELNLADGRA
jgi:hypothetical protein